MSSTLNAESLENMRPWSLAIALPIALWCISVAVSNPTGNFPLNDDWSFAWTVRHLIDTGEFRPLGWTAMTLVGQTLWGAAFSLLFGYGFEVLRAATLVAALIGLLCFSLLLRSLDCDRRTTAIVTATLGFNPLFFSLSQTFMTDVEFTSAAIASTLCFCRYLQTRQRSAMLLSLLCAALALSIRQLALYLPVAMLLTLLLERRRDRVGIALSAVGLLAGIAMFKGFEFWLASRHATPAVFKGLPPYESLKNHLSPARALALAISVEQHVRGMLLYLGWLTAPVLILRFPDIVHTYSHNRRSQLALVGTVVCGLALGVLMVALHRMMPVGDNVIHVIGIGPIVLSGWPDVLNGWSEHPKLTSLPSGFWIYTTLLAALGAALLLLQIVTTLYSLWAGVRRRTSDGAHSLRAFLLIGCAVYLSPFVVLGYIDRYLLPGVFMMLALIAMPANPKQSPLQRSSFSRRLHGVSVALLAVMALYAVAGTHDYLSWNRARWTLLGKLANEGVPPTSIDGGFEFNGLYLYDPSFAPGPNRSWWWVQDDRFIVDFVPRPGYRVVDQAEVSGWLPPFRIKMLLLERG